MLTRARVLAAAGCVALLAPVPSPALEPLPDAAMSGVTAQDGIETVFTAPAVSIQSLNITPDSDKHLTTATGVIGTVAGAGTTPLAATLALQGMQMGRVDAVGITGGGNFNVYASLDVGTAAQTGGGAAVRFTAAYDRARIRIDSIRHAGDPSRYYGAMALDASASMEIFNPGGLFNDASTTTYLRGQLNDANLFYRQVWFQHPYLILKDLDASWIIPAGSVGVTDQGIRMTGDIDVNLDFDLMYKFPFHHGGLDATTDFVITGNERPVLYFGWAGRLTNAELVWRGGGSWYGVPGTVYNEANKSEGLFFSSRWDYYNRNNFAVPSSPTAQELAREFRWQLTEAGGRRVGFELADWAKLPGATHAWNFPLIGFDVINAGQGAGGICWGQDVAAGGGACTGTGRKLLELTAGTVANFGHGTPAAPRTNASPMAFYIRDGNLLSYARKVKIVEDTNGDGISETVLDKAWGLNYTLANVDGSVYLYPGGNAGDIAGGSQNGGLIADVVLVSQTFDSGTGLQGYNWGKGTHLMISDTNPDGNLATNDGVGIGLLSANILLAADDLRVYVKPNWNAADNYEGGIDLFSFNTRTNIKGTFAGVRTIDGSGFVTMGGVDVNLEGMMNLRLSPSPAGANYIGLSAAARFGALSGGIASGAGTYLSLYEPSKPLVDFRLASITGDMAMVQGRVDMKSPNDAGGPDRFRLVLEGDLQFGATAAARVSDSLSGATTPAGWAAAGQPFTVGAVQFGGKSLGQLVIPSGQVHSALTLMPKTP